MPQAAGICLQYGGGFAVRFRGFLLRFQAALDQHTGGVRVHGVPFELDSEAVGLAQQAGDGLRRRRERVAREQRQGGNAADFAARVVDRCQSGRAGTHSDSTRLRPLALAR